MELLLPMAAQKLDLTFNIDANVPTCTSTQNFSRSLLKINQGVYSDYARIRQGRDPYFLLEQNSFISQF
jgi:hypothetical protein